MKSIDAFLDRVPTKHYNCLDFVHEVWLELMGEDVKAKLDKLVAKVGCVDISAVKQFEQLKQPINPCFVVMQRKGFTPHCGIYLNGRILHLTATGAQLQLVGIASKCFSKVKYYK